LKDEAIKKVIKGVVERNNNYNLVFYLPIEFPMEIDKIRSHDLGFQKEVDIRYKRYLEELGAKYIPLSDSVEERIEQAIKYLK